MPYDSSRQGAYLISQWLQKFRASLSPEMLARFKKGFGQEKIRDPIQLQYPLVLDDSRTPVHLPDRTLGVGGFNTIPPGGDDWADLPPPVIPPATGGGTGLTATATATSMTTVPTSSGGPPPSSGASSVMTPGSSDFVNVTGSEASSGGGPLALCATSLCNPEFTSTSECNSIAATFGDAQCPLFLAFEETADLACGGASTRTRFYSLCGCHLCYDWGAFPDMNCSDNSLQSYPVHDAAWKCCYLANADNVCFGSLSLRCRTVSGVVNGSNRTCAYSVDDLLGACSPCVSP